MLLGKLNWLICNEVEAAQISGRVEPKATWQVLHKKYPQLQLVVTLGENGSVVFTEKEEIQKEAFHVKAVDTTAAGDTYTGYFVAGLMEGRPLEECMRWASLASCISVTRLGAAVSIPKREEVERVKEVNLCMPILIMNA